MVFERKRPLGECHASVKQSEPGLLPGGIQRRDQPR